MCHFLRRGPFAHQSLAFDLYSGSRDHPQIVNVTEETVMTCDRSEPSDGVARVALEMMDSEVGSSRAECMRQLHASNAVGVVTTQTFGFDESNKFEPLNSRSLHCLDFRFSFVIESTRGRLHTGA